MRPADPRLLRHARAARGYLVVTAALGVVTTGMVVAQAELVARLLAGAGRGTGPAALSAALIALLAVVAVRAAAAYGGEVAALRAAATVKSQLRRSLADCLQRLVPGWLGRQQPGEITTVATRGLDGLDPYFARYLPQLVLACLVPAAVLATVAAADWISAVIIAVTLPLIPIFAALVGMHTRARTQRQLSRAALKHRCASMSARISVGTTSPPTSTCSRRSHSTANGGSASSVGSSRQCRSTELEAP